METFGVSVLALATALLLDLLSLFKLFPEARVADPKPKIDGSPYPGKLFRIEFRSEQCQVSFGPRGRSTSQWWKCSTRGGIVWVKFIGRVPEVLNRKRALSLRMVKRLHDGLRIPYESLLSRAA